MMPAHVDKMLVCMFVNHVYGFWKNEFISLANGRRFGGCVLLDMVGHQAGSYDSRDPQRDLVKVAAVRNDGEERTCFENVTQ